MCVHNSLLQSINKNKSSLTLCSPTGAPWILGGRAGTKPEPIPRELLLQVPRSSSQREAPPRGAGLAREVGARGAVESSWAEAFLQRRRSGVPPAGYPRGV